MPAGVPLGAHLCIYSLPMLTTCDLYLSLLEFIVPSNVWQGVLIMKPLQYTTFSFLMSVPHPVLDTNTLLSTLYVLILIY
jgi:hypothetical protein